MMRTALSRRLRRAINKRAAAQVRPIIDAAYRMAREALTATATDLLMAGRPLGDVLAELAAADLFALGANDGEP